MSVFEGDLGVKDPDSSCSWDITMGPRSVFPMRNIDKRARTKRKKRIANFHQRHLPGIINFEVTCAIENILDGVRPEDPNLSINSWLNWTKIPSFEKSIGQFFTITFAHIIHI